MRMSPLSCRMSGLVVATVLLAAFTLAGCASSLETAQKIHSYTPCGMMMNAVMQHPQPTSGAQEETTTEPAVESSDESTDKASAGAAEHSAH